MSVLTNYLYIASLKYLDCTVVTAIFATNASFVYLLSWVVLRQQFVGVRVVALILSTTGISLLAYMDYERQQEILIPVILASASAAGTAVYKVMFKKVMGEVNFLQVSIFFSVSCPGLSSPQRNICLAGDRGPELRDALAGGGDPLLDGVRDPGLDLCALATPLRCCGPLSG